MERIITQVKNYYKKFNLLGSLDLSPIYILNRLKDLIETPLNGKYHIKVPLWGILIRYYLSPKRVILEYNLPKKAFD